eukprot:CAMPEP_0171238594 /NCGR_PEP_ID=MMETSP0790-20130122/43552_1 /TAXON_ID=2925 /ORGANISM="Alexandrium catenella, Strain OF101" /LENGTH=78 /DNA_ID=CAMNT_0011704961 /DNA_START=173 /DNA_END=405 /DNA_ORIENTATION=+
MLRETLLGLRSSEAGIPKAACPSLDFRFQHLDLGVLREARLKVLQLLALLGLDLQRNLATAVEEAGNLAEVLRGASPR